MKGEESSCKRFSCPSSDSNRMSSEDILFQNDLSVYNSSLLTQDVMRRGSIINSHIAKLFFKNLIYVLPPFSCSWSQLWNGLDCRSRKRTNLDPVCCVRFLYARTYTDSTNDVWTISLFLGSSRCDQHSVLISLSMGREEEEKYRSHDYTIFSSLFSCSRDTHDKPSRCV